LYILYFKSQARPRSTLFPFKEIHACSFQLLCYNCLPLFQSTFSFPPDQKSLSGETGCKYSPYFNFSKKNCKKIPSENSL